jgi:glycerol-3-phosphate O-acyltransferase
MVVWERSPDRVDPLAQFFLGKQGVPGWARRWWRAMRGGDSFVQVGRPIDLRALAERIGKERLAGVARRISARNLGDERKLVAGPRLLPYGTLKKLVLDNPPMRQFAKTEAEAQGWPLQRVEKEMTRDYHRIAANFSWTIIEALHVVLRPLWTRVFSGVDARPEDIDRIRAAMRDGSVIFAPCHRSHFDYVLMSWVMYDHDLIVPHVVAGMNLAVWPVSIVLRGAGGFFVKRSFAGDRIFSTVFARYLRELVLREYPVEFFIEGGRTRTGRLMPPKMGVLSMVLDAAEVRAHGRDVTVLPIALAYEQVAEEGAYERELGGEPKRPETLGQIFKARSVFRRRFGRVYLRVGEPLRCGALVDAADGVPAWSERLPEDRKAVTSAVAHRIVAAIGREMVLLPTSLVAMALLAVPRRAILASELQERILRFDQLFDRLRTPRAASLARFDQAIAQALDRFVRDGRIEPLEHQGRRLWAIDPDERLMLDFYKNQILHALAPMGLAACALRARPDGPVAAAELVEDAGALMRLLRRELVFGPEDPPERVLADGLARLVEHGALAEDQGRLQVVDPVRIGEIHGLFRPLLEGYLAVLRAPVWPETREAAPNAIRAAQARLVAEGIVACPESLSAAALQNAIGTHSEDGVLVPEGDRLRPAPGADERAARLAAMVGIR